MSFKLAIIGRPNVGKSTLFNRLTGKKMSIVNDRPGVTRDWQVADARLFDLKFQIIDTAGLEESFNDSIEGRMRRQTEAALENADMALMMIDARAGLTPLDHHFAAWIRQRNIPVLLVGNKCDTNAGKKGIYEAYELGLGTPIEMSAEHGLGMDELHELLEPYVKAVMPEIIEDDEEEAEAAALAAYDEGTGIGFGDEELPEEEFVKPIKMAIVGRPNVGKSTLVNALLKEERMMTGPEAGITRDAVSIDWTYGGRDLTLVDTAGMRKRTRIVDLVEKDAVGDALRAIRLAQTVVLVLDANLILERQDMTIADHVIREGRALIIAVNKWDEVENRAELLKEFRYRLNKSLPQVKDIPIVTISALNGRRLDKLMDAVFETYDLWNSRVATAKLNRWLSMMVSHHPAPLSQGRPNKMRYMTQIKARPPSFAIWVSRPKDVPDSYERYLVNGLRDDFDLPGVPIRLFLRTSKNPYSDKH
jgi:GTP-binding protein